MDWNGDENFTNSDAELLVEDNTEVLEDNVQDVKLIDAAASSPSETPSATPNILIVDSEESNNTHSAFCGRCRTISSSFLGNALRSRSQYNELSESCRYDQSIQQYYAAPSSDDIPLLNDDVGDRSARSCRDVAADDHCHPPKPARTASRKAITKLLIACILSLLFMVIEVVGGYFANSIAIMSDAAHMFSDLTSFIVSLVAIFLAMRPASRTMSYGYHRAEVLGALISVLIIWVLTGVLVYAAVQRVSSMDFEVNADIMIIISFVGVVMNIILGVVLHTGGGGHGHSHGLGGGHGHSHGGGGDGHSHGGEHNHGNSGSTHIDIASGGDGGVLDNTSTATTASSAASRTPPTTTNINVRAAYIHVLGDLIQSIGVLIAAYIIRFYPEYKIADPICTFLFSVLVVLTTVPIIRDLGRVLMEGVPPGVDYGAMSGHLAALPGVKMVHSLHVWTLTVDKNACSVHLAIDSDSEPDVVLKAAQRVVRRRHHIYHTTIQVERYNQQLMDNCNQCQPL